MFYFYTIYNNDICQLGQQVMGSFLHLKQFDQEFASRDQLQRVGSRQVHFTIYHLLLMTKFDISLCGMMRNLVL